MEIRNPGGIYGRITVDQLGKVQPDTRNPVIASILEVLKITENRYSGIPTIRRCMREYHLPQPEFADERGNFVVTLCKTGNTYSAADISNADEELLRFCKTPRTRREICDYLGIRSVAYAMRTRVMPLVQSNRLKMSIPDKPKSEKQKFFTDMN